MATTSTIRPGPRNKPLRGATGSVPHGRTIRQGLAVICVPTRGRPAFRPGRTRALVALAGLAFAASPAGAQASPPPWGAALLAGYPGLVSEVTAHDVILRDGTRFPIAPSPPLAAPGDDPPARNVAIFERHGFIWGGRWSHFDTMHFEYRPELLPPGRDNDAIVARVRGALPALHDAACGSTPGGLTESLSPTRALMVTPCAYA